MKKIIYSMFALFMALSFASCEDVPAPYDDPANGNGGLGDSTYVSELFTVNKGSFDIKTIKGKGWGIDHNVMTASGFDFSDKTTIESESYLISQPFDLSESNGAYISFKYIYMYGTPEAQDQVLITDKYTGDPTTTEWTDLSIKWEDAVIKDFDTYYNYDQNIPAEFIGKENVVLAFGFKCSAKKTSTFKIKNLLVKEGVAEENQGGGDEPETGDVIKPADGKFIHETFGSSFGVFSEKTIAGKPWIIDFHTAKATGYDNASKVTTASNSYLVSKPMDMTNSKEASVNFEYILRYVTDFNTHEPVPGIVNEVLITDNYTGDPTTTQWTNISGKLIEGTDWTTFSKYDVDVPAQFLGKGKVVVALHYACEAKSGTWEVKNMNVVEAKAGQGGGDDQPGGDTPEDEGDVKASNGDFETWVDGEPNNWDGPASKANLFQSKDAHSGKYSVQVGGSSDGNMRLGYKLMTLKAGHYVMKFFTKAVTAEGGSVRPGYVVLTNGKPTGGNDYKYGDYTNDLKNDAWTEVTYEFDITAEGEYTVCVMNAKKPGKDILVDDFTLECNGEFIIK